MLGIALLTRDRVDDQNRFWQGRSNSSKKNPRVSGLPDALTIDCYFRISSLILCRAIQIVLWLKILCKKCNERNRRNWYSKNSGFYSGILSLGSGWISIFISWGIL